MGREKLREDKTCLNCRHVVEHRFCPNCGQENTDTRKTFHHLFVHFFEDLTHYENAFWKTIRNLILRPSALTKEYLSGKRLSYLAPVRLYIFISFVTFFLIAVLPNSEEDELVQFKTTPADRSVISDSLKTDFARIDQLVKEGRLKEKQGEKIKEMIAKPVGEESFGEVFGYRSVKQLDSAQAASIKNGKEPEFSDSEYWFFKKVLTVSEKNTNSEIYEKFKEAFSRNFSKVLFIYMPLFAFFLWLFHNKKRWYYFDHGIFTLHYFSFLLLMILITEVVLAIAAFINVEIVTIISDIFDWLTSIWMIYYLFPAHHRFYGGTRLKSFFKTLVLLGINFVVFLIIMLFFIIYTFINLH